MPLYEYRCHGCGKTFEVRQKFSDPPLNKHDECGGEVERLLSPPAFQFKGSGWYVTDYGRNGKDSKTREAKSKPESKTESKAESKTESKTDKKPAAPSSSSS
jgi:putative FmdB family regulatory protein